jgi:hypothetical protein
MFLTAKLRIIYQKAKAFAQNLHDSRVKETFLLGFSYRLPTENRQVAYCLMLTIGQLSVVGFSL